MKISGAKWTGILFLLAAVVALAQEGDAYHQALLNYKSGNYDAARVAIDEAATAQPDNIPTAILKARILTELHQFKEAKNALEGLNGNPGLTPTYEEGRLMAFGDLCLRQRSFDEASKFYEMAIASKPGDPDITLKIIYARVGAGDYVMAEKYASGLKPLDPLNPSYYFARAALAEATGKSVEADEDIQTVRTIYGISVTNRYLKSYLPIFASGHEASPASRAEPSSKPGAGRATNSDQPAKP